MPIDLKLYPATSMTLMPLDKRLYPVILLCYNMRMSKKQAGVYRWHNTTTGKSYVGSSINLTGRKSTHLSLLRSGKSHSPKLQAAWNKYGEAAFTWEVLEHCASEDLTAAEVKWIAKFDSVENGYNCSDDAASPMRGNHWRPESIERKKANKRPPTVAQSAAARANLRQYNLSQKGIPKSATHRSKIGLSRAGKKMPESALAKMRGRVVSEATREKMRNRVFSAECRQKMREAASGRHGADHSRSRPVLQCALDGTVLARFANTVEAAKAMPVSRSSIKNCLRGRSKTSAGFVWKYEEGG